MSGCPACQTTMTREPDSEGYFTCPNCGRWRHSAVPRDIDDRAARAALVHAASLLRRRSSERFAAKGLRDKRAVALWDAACYIDPFDHDALMMGDRSTEFDATDQASLEGRLRLYLNDTGRHVVGHREPCGRGICSKPSGHPGRCDY